MYVVDIAETAMKNVGIKPIIKPIRGGTDGSKISFMGLPTPNIFTSGENFHGKYEFISLENMKKAVDVIIEIIKVKWKQIKKKGNGMKFYQQQKKRWKHWAGTVWMFFLSLEIHIDTYYNGSALVGKWLVKHGFKVGIIAQPEVDVATDITSEWASQTYFLQCLEGLCWLYGCKLYCNKKRRQQDDFTPGGENNRGQIG